MDSELEDVYLETLAKSPLATLKKMSSAGATKAGQEYTQSFKGKRLGSIVFGVW